MVQLWQIVRITKRFRQLPIAEKMSDTGCAASVRKSQHHQKKKKKTHDERK